MKLAYIGPTGIFGGVRILVEHCNRLAARGHDVTLIGTSGEPMTWLPAQFEQRPITDPGSGYDAVVGTSLNTWPMAVGIAGGTGRPFGLLQMAEWLNFAKDGPDYQAQMAHFTAPVEVLAISDWLAQLSEAAAHVTHRIRNGIDPALFFHEPFGDLKPFDGLSIISEGYSHNPTKDIDEYFARAVRYLKYDLGRRVRTFGFSQYPATFEFDQFAQTPPQEMIRKIYSSGDVFLKASRYEGRPGPDLEAMACGAVVCRAIGTGDDDLLDGENCLKVRYGDYDGFVANLLRLADDAELRAKLRANGLAYVKEHCGWDGAIDLVEQALTGSVTVPDPTKDYAYELSTYNPMQAEIVGWETPQAMWLGETLADLLEPESVIDIGCGPGTYLTPFKPAARVLGVDGAPEAGQALEADEFTTADFRQEWTPNGHGHFDLGLCIEVAEHLPPTRADYLVRLLTSSADTVFFSAAHPGQGGTLHLNEQPPEYWLERFRGYGFDLHPLNAKLRAMVAANPHCQRVQWLIPNCLLLTKAESYATPT